MGSRPWPSSPHVTCLLAAAVSTMGLVFGEEGIAPKAHLNFAIQAGPHAAGEHYSTVFILDGQKKMAEVYTSFTAPAEVQVPDGHYTVLLAPVSGGHLSSGIGGKYECTIVKGESAPIPVVPTPIITTPTHVLYDDGAPVPGAIVEVMIATYAGSGCLVDHMQRFTLDKAGTFDLPAIPGELYQLQIQLQDYVQHPIVISPAFGITKEIPAALRVQLDPIPSMRVKFVTTGNDGKEALLSAGAIATLHPLPKGGFYPLPIDPESELRMEFLPDNLHLEAAKSIQFGIPGFALVPDEVEVKGIPRQVVTIHCSARAKEHTPDPVPQAAPFCISVVSNGAVRKDGELSYEKVREGADPTTSMEPCLRTGDLFIIKEPETDTFLYFASLVGDCSAIFRQRVTIKPGGITTLHVDEIPHHVSMHLVNSQNKIGDRPFLYVIDAQSALLSGLAKPRDASHADIFPVGLYAGSYRVISEDENGSYEIGAIMIAKNDPPDQDVTFDLNQRKPVLTKLYEKATLSALRGH